MSEKLKEGRKRMEEFYYEPGDKKLDMFIKTPGEKHDWEWRWEWILHKPQDGYKGCFRHLCMETLLEKLEETVLWHHTAEFHCVITTPKMEKAKRGTRKKQKGAVKKANRSTYC